MVALCQGFFLRFTIEQTAITRPPRALRSVRPSWLFRHGKGCCLFRRPFESGHHRSLFVGFRISSAHQDHATCRAWVHDQCLFIEDCPGGCAFQQFHQVALDADITLPFPGRPCGRYIQSPSVRLSRISPRKMEAFVDDVFFFQSVDGRFDDAGAYFFSMYSSSANGTGRHAALTACVEVLCRLHRYACSLSLRGGGTL